MIVCKTLSEFMSAREKLGENVGFVPTMGALHNGHLSLIQESQQSCNKTVVSIFVNPTQFNNPLDLQKYPRTLDADLKKLEQLNVDVVFCPDKEQLYPQGFDVKVTEDHDSHILCGAHRPGHFTGVLSVVMKLFNIVRPQKCFMGEKDYQQLHLIKKMCAQLFVPVEVVGCPTLREADGLAMSSRNINLSAEEREMAPLIHKLLKSDKSCEQIRDELSAAGFQVDYVEEHWGRRFAAATLGSVRLIDNV